MNLGLFKQARNQDASSGATCLPAYSCFSKLAQCKSTCWSRTKRTIGIEYKHNGYCMRNKLRNKN